MSFTHLQVHSEFSLKDSLIRVDELAKRIKSEGMPAVALTDHNNLYGFVKFYQSCLKMGSNPFVGLIYPFNIKDILAASFLLR